MSKNKLNELIEYKRKQLFKTAAKYGINSQVVLNSSHELDKLINEYNRLEKKVGKLK